MRPTPKVLRVARALTASGVSVMWCPAGTKAPIDKWKRWQSEIASEALLKRWFCEGRNLIAIGGAVSGNLEIMDFDEPEYYPAFAEMCGTGRLGELVNSCCLIQTPSGGHHLYYRCADPVKGNTKLARTKRIEADTDNSGVVKIETRAEGGYVLTYPSPGYRILRGKPTELPVLSAFQVEILHNVAEIFDDYLEQKPAVSSVKQNRKMQSRQGLTSWEDYNHRGDYTALLRKHGWRIVRCNANDYCAWCRPGKKSGVSATTGHGGRRLFICFTSNGYPFECRGYDPAGVYAVLECSGDYREAGRRLAKEGFGQ